MVRLSKRTIFGLSLGLLLVAALMVAVGLISYRRLVQPWKELVCEVKSSGYEECGESEYCVVTTVSINGSSQAAVKTVDDSRVFYETM